MLSRSALGRTGWTTGAPGSCPRIVLRPWIPRLREIRRDEGDPDQVVAPTQLPGEPLAARKVEDGDVGVDVLGEEVEAERAVVEPRRRRPLGLRDLVVEELYEVLFPAPGVVDAEGTEDPREQDAVRCPGGAAARTDRPSTSPPGVEDAAREVGARRPAPVDSSS